MNDIRVTNRLGVLKLYQATATDTATGISRSAESDRLNEARSTAARELYSALAALRLADEEPDEELQCSFAISTTLANPERCGYHAGHDGEHKP